jgi:DNA-binding IclR family transcriptional regulator
LTITGKILRPVQPDWIQMPETKRIPTNLRTLLILEIMGGSDVPLSPTEINSKLGLPKQTVHRLCATLVEEGYLVYEPSGKRLRPARRLRLLASGVLFASRIHISRRQILTNVAKEVRETVNFVVPEINGMNYLDRVETDWPFRVQLPIGTHVPFHCTASGKTFLAGLSRSARRKMVAALHLEEKTKNTVTDHAQLLEQLDDVARLGYAIDNEEFMEGMVAIAVPINDSCGRFLAALAFHGPNIRLSVENMIERKSVLTDAAHKLGQILIDE